MLRFNGFHSLDQHAQISGIEEQATFPWLDGVSDALSGEDFILENAETAAAQRERTGVLEPQRAKVYSNRSPRPWPVAAALDIRVDGTCFGGDFHHLCCCSYAQLRVQTVFARTDIWLRNGVLLKAGMQKLQSILTGPK